MVSDNAGNSEILFSTINQLLNPAPSTDFLSQASALKCEELAKFFDDKIITIRGGIIDTGDPYDKMHNKHVTMDQFTSISAAELYKTVTESNSSTS